MVTGRRPFDGTSWHLVHQHLNEEPPALRTRRPDASVELERFVSRLLAKGPAQRLASAEVRDALKEINDRHRGAPQPSRGSDLSGNVVVSHAEAADGAISPLRIITRKNCFACASP